MKTNIDHIAIAANTIEEGVAYIHEQLGVDIPKGGEHPAMATHNHLMQLGENLFLEVLAINPEMTAPDSPRWFGLEDPFVRHSIASKVRLHTWIVNTSDIDSLENQDAFDFGKVAGLSRGDLSWKFAVPEDGRLLAGGLVPYVMQWDGMGRDGFRHPSQGMADLGCELVGLELHHPQADWLASILDLIKAKDLVIIQELSPHEVPYIVANIQTPTGLKKLTSQV